MIDREREKERKDDKKERRENKKVREGRKFVRVYHICDERCGERRVLLGGVTKFHERVSPLRPGLRLSVCECEKEENGRSRASERETADVLGSALPCRACTRKRETKGRQRAKAERKTDRERERERETGAGEENGSSGAE